MKFVAYVALLLIFGCESARTSVVVSRERDAKSAPSSPRVAANDPRVPVVVELFSSEGCSSCPPADEALRELDEQQPIQGVLVIPLEMHVDYWNDLGWVDPFSSRTFSARQEGYAAASPGNGVFTPEAIVDGSATIVGSDRPGLADLIHDAAARPHIPIAIEPRGQKAPVVVGAGAPDGAPLGLANPEPGPETTVTAGENRGRRLRHAPRRSQPHRAVGAAAARRVRRRPWRTGPSVGRKVRRVRRGEGRWRDRRGGVGVALIGALGEPRHAPCVNRRLPRRRPRRSVRFGSRAPGRRAALRAHRPSMGRAFLLRASPPNASATRG